MTARETYRSPMTPQDAIAELRRVAGRQLDAELVESFIAMLERDGPVTSPTARRQLRDRACLRAARPQDRAATLERLTNVTCIANLPAVKATDPA